MVARLTPSPLVHCMLCQAYNRVLLDGGPCRWFSPSDVPALEADLQQVALLFEAEGEGLPR